MSGTENFRQLPFGITLLDRERRRSTQFRAPEELAQDVGATARLLARVQANAGRAIYPFFLLLVVIFFLLLPSACNYP